MSIEGESFPAGSRDPQLLLTAMQRISQEQLGAALDRVLRRTDDYLFDSSNSGGGELTALRDLRRARAQLQQRFDQALVAGFRRLQEAPMPGKAMDASSLSLVSDEALEEQLATEQIVDSLGKAFAPGLELLDKRLAALTERPVLLARDNPAGPKFIAESMSGAMAALEVSTGIRIVVYKYLERELGSVLGPLYERLNTGLAAAGVLPMIKPTKRAEPLPQQATTGAGPGPGDGTGMGHGEPSDAATAATAAAAAAMAGAVSGPGGMTGPGDQALFSSLLNLLQTWRQAMHPPGTGDGGGGGAGPRMSTTDVMTVLSLLQREAPGSVEASGDSRQPLAEQMRNQLIDGARRLGMGERANLSNVDEDAVDLVGMLFDVLLDERHFEPDVRTKLNRLLVPYIKVAVKDRRLFLYKAHPARRLLNVVAEASEGNRGESVQDRELMARVDGTIERLVVEFNEDIAIFETLEAELRSFMEQHRKRVEVTERRAAEAQRGKERLEQAREDVAVDLTIVRQSRQLPPALDAFVVRFAAHHLTQLVLREGKESANYAATIRALQELMAIYDQAELGVPLDRLPGLDLPAMEAILASSGLLNNSAHDVIATLQRTLARLSAGDEVAASAEQLPVAPVPVAPEPAAVEGPDLELVAGKATLDFDPAMADRMRALEVGTWLQLTSESGRVEPAKVSWVSPISGRLLFVNRRGIRVLVASVEELAAMARLGRVQLREADTAFDDAMHQVIGRLQSSTPPGASASG